MSDDEINGPSADDTLHDVLRAFERMKRAAEDATSIPPEMMNGLGEAGRAYSQGGRQQGKTQRVGERIFIGMDAANKQGDHTGFSFRNDRGELLTITIGPSERVTAEVVRRKVREVIHAAQIEKLVKERDRDRERYEGEADKAGHRVVEGEVLGRSFERTAA